MKSLLRNMTVATAALTIGFSIFARDNGRWDNESQRRKAEYIYGEAQRQNALGNGGGTYELYRRAYELDSTNSDYYSELGLNYIMMVKRDEPLMLEAIDLLRKKFEADPTDYTNAYYYSQMMGNTGNTARQIEVLHVVDSLNPTRSDIALSYIDALLSSEDSVMVRRAVDRLEKLEVTAGKSMELTRRKTAIYAFLNDSASALREIHGAIASSPLNPECYSFAGRYFEVQGKLDSALVYYQKACEVSPESGSAAFILAQYYKNSGDTIGYSREIDRALLETDLDIDDKHEILLSYTRDLINDSTYLPHVNALFNRVIEKNPQEPSIRSLYADFLSVQEDYKGAAEQMEPVLDLQPDDKDNWIRAGILYLQDDNYARAESTLVRALKYHDSEADIHRILSSTLYLADKDKNTGRAIEEMHRAYELTDSSNIVSRSEYLSNIADFYSGDEQTDSAAVYYAKAIEINPRNTLACNNFAYHLSASDDPELLDRANELSFATLAEEPDNPIYIDTYAWILFKQKDYKRAKDYIDRALANSTEENLSAEYYTHAGDIYFWNQMPDEAVEFWKKALELDPDNELLARKVKYKTYFHE
ncbi:MAG: tetratricopeptide repeat protein [Muribaculaceae bacterium]|nr:tetratricopeptide repeat protein [Muribaculaceae bacterium]